MVAAIRREGHRNHYRSDPEPQSKDTVDNQTRHKLKQDNFITTTRHGLEWAGENRRSVITTSILLLAVIVLAVGGVAIYNYRSDKAAADFGNAMLTYSAPITEPGQPAPQGTQSFASAQDRAAAAHTEFMAIANRYGITPAGRNALYFAGLTDMEAGQNASAEDALTKVSHSWDRNLAALGRAALASLYHQTGRDDKAIDTYNQMIAHPTDTMTEGMAKLQLAALYESMGRNDDAKKIYAALKDSDAKGAAGEIAAQKLNGDQQPAQ